MKIRISCKNNETTAEYSRLDNSDSFRKSILDLMIEYFVSSILYVDTNNGTGFIEREDIKKVMDQCEIDCAIEEIEPVQQKFLGFAMPFRKNKKKETKSAYRVIASMSREVDADKLYSSFLRYFDYALCSGIDKKPEEIIFMFRRGIEDVLFNKEIIENTFYDSIVVKRLRIDMINEKLADKLKRYNEKE